MKDMEWVMLIFLICFLGALSDRYFVYLERKRFDESVVERYKAENERLKEIIKLNDGRNL